MALKLEVFEVNQNERAYKTVVIDSLQLEETKLTAYDAGYAAGWEDATAAQSTEQNKTQADLARNLQTLGFTYHEARNHILKSLRPLLTEILGKLMPEIAKRSLSGRILESLMPMAESFTDVPIELRVNPTGRAFVGGLVEGATSLPLQISEESSLGDGQIYIKMGAHEVKIDTDRTIAEIGSAVAAFFDSAEKEIIND